MLHIPPSLKHQQLGLSFDTFSLPAVLISSSDMQANKLGEQLFAPSLGPHHSALDTVPSLKGLSSTDCCCVCFLTAKLRVLCLFSCDMQANKLGEQIFAPNMGPHHSALDAVQSFRGLSSTDCCAGPAARFGPTSLPPLNEDTYVDKDTLSRLFMVSSKVAQEVRVSMQSQELVMKACVLVQRRCWLC
jgi:hypothetical protein